MATTQDRLNQFRSAMNNLNANFSSTIQSQTTRLDSMHVGMSQANINNQREILMGERDLLNSQLQLMKRNFKRYKKHMSSAERQAFMTTFRNRRDDLRRLEREARYRFEEIGDHGVDAAERTSDAWGNVQEKLRDLADSLALNSLVDGMTDTAQSVVESQREMQKLTGLSREQLREIDKTTDKLLKKYDYKFSRQEIYDNASQLVQQFGIKDIDLLNEVTELFSKQQKANDATVESIEGMFKMSQMPGFDTSDLDRWGNWVRAMADSELWVKPEQMYDWFNESYESLKGKWKDDAVGFNNEMQSILSLRSALSNNFTDSSQIMEMLNELKLASPTEMAELYTKYGGSVDVNNVQALLNSGDWESAGTLLVSGIQAQLADPAMRNYWRQQLGEDVDSLLAIPMERFSTDMQKAKDALAKGDTEDLLSKAIDNQVLGPFEKFKNRLGNTKPVKWLSDFMGESGLSASDILLATNLLPLGAIGKGAWKLTKGTAKLGWKGLKGGAKGIWSGAKGLYRAGGNIRAGYQLARSGGSGVLSSLFNGTRNAMSGPGFMGGLFKGGASTASRTASRTASAVANTASTGAGVADDVARTGSRLLSKIPGLGKVSKLASKASGPLAFLGLGLDGAMALGKSEEWLGDNSASSKLSSFVGGALGGTGKGIAGDESIGKKALDLGSGALKGAGVGAAIGSIIPGVGTAIGGAVGGVVGTIGSAIGGENIAKATKWVTKKATDTWDWTKKQAGKAWKATEKVAKTVWSGIETVGKDIWSGVKTVATDTWTGVKTVATDTWSGVKTVADDTWTGISTVATDTWDGVKTVANDTWDGISIVANDTWDGVKSVGTGIWSGIETAGKGIWSGIETVGKGIWSGIETAGKGIWSGIETVGKGIWDGIETAGKDMWDDAKKVANDYWDGLKKVAKTAFEGVAGVAKDTWGGVKKVGSDLWSGITTGVGDIWNKLLGKGDKGADTDWYVAMLATSVGIYKRLNEMNSINGSHKTGLAYVPYDGYTAELHKGERVLTASESKEYSNSTNTNNTNNSTHNYSKTVYDTHNETPRIVYNTNETHIDGSHKNGLRSVPFNGYKARLHKGERILTAAESKLYNNAKTRHTIISNNAKGTSKFMHKTFDGFKGQVKDILSKYWTAQKTTTGTGDGGSGGGSGSGGGTYTQATGDTVPKQVWKFLTGQGFSKASTAGILGNMKAESDVDPTRIQGGGKGPAAGIVQWENYNTKSGRWKAMSDYAKSKGAQWTDLQSQLEWLDQELQGKDSTTAYLLKRLVGGYDSFKSLTSVDRATEVFENAFERAGIKRMETRKKYANEFYNQLNAYEQGTPWVPNTQLALLHKGEMVVPAANNPLNNAMTTTTGTVVNNENHTQEIVDVVKWAVFRLEKKLDDVVKSIPTSTAPKIKRKSNTDEVFQF